MALLQATPNDKHSSMHHSSAWQSTYVQDTPVYDSGIGVPEDIHVGPDAHATPEYTRHTRSLISALQSPSAPFRDEQQQSLRYIGHASPRPGTSPRAQQDRQPKPPFSSRSLSLEHPRHQHDVRYTKKPIGDPPVRELHPLAPSQVIRLKHRAATLIQRYAGSNWQTAQRTKWILDVVTHIDKDYREYIMDQAFQIQHLQQQIELMQSNHAGVLSVTQTKASELEDLARQQQAQLRDQAATILDLQTRLAESEATLGVAEQAATATAHEMAALHQAVSAVTEHDARARKMLANRAYNLKEALRASQSTLRHKTEASRRHDVEVTAMLQLKDEELTREKASLGAHFMSQIAAVHQVERAAAKVEVDRVRLELDAYKEPWTYSYGRLSPTKNKELAISLGLDTASLNTVMPPC